MESGKALEEEGDGALHVSCQPQLLLGLFNGQAYLDLPNETSHHAQQAGLEEAMVSEGHG